MDALDPSSKMLEEARKKGLYGRYFIEVLGENTIDIENGTWWEWSVCDSEALSVLWYVPKKVFLLAIGHALCIRTRYCHTHI